MQARRRMLTMTGQTFMVSTSVGIEGEYIDQVRHSIQLLHLL